MRLQFEGLIEGMIEDGQYPSKQVRFVLSPPLSWANRHGQGAGGVFVRPYVRSANSAPRRNRRRYRASGAACPRKAGTKIRSTRQ